MNEIQIFKNTEFGSVRTTLINNEPWFVGKDVAAILGYERPTKAIFDHVDSEDKDEIPIQDSIGRMQNTPIINESGLYSLILSSKLESAKKFKHWVTGEVLPAIRKTGTYKAKEKKPNLSSVNMMARLIKDSYEKAGVDPDFIIAAINNIYKEQINMEIPLPIKSADEELYDYTAIAKKLNIYSKTGKPHSKAVSAIIQKLKISRDLIVKTPFVKNGHSGFTDQYKGNVIDMVKNWLEENNYPSVISFKNKNKEESIYVTYSFEKAV